MIPKNPFILLSYVNTKLRDEFSSLESLCDNLNISENEIKDLLKSIGYEYNAENNKFVCK